MNHLDSAKDEIEFGGLVKKDPAAEAAPSDPASAPVVVYPSWARHGTLGRLAFEAWLFLVFLFGEGSVGASVFVLLSATLGAGTLAFPFAFKECGWILASVLMIACGVAAFYSIYLLVLCSILTGKNSYEELAHTLFGRTTEIVVDISIIIFTWGSTVAYMVIIGDTLPPLMELLFGVRSDSILAQAWFLLILCTILFIFPLTLLSRINSLRYTSFLGFAATVYLIIVVVAESSRDLPPGGLSLNRMKAAHLNSRLFVGLPIIFYGFSSHVNIFSIYRELRVPSISSAVKVIGGNIVIAFITYGSLGLFGYLAFLDKTEGNILQNYSADNIPIQIGALTIAISVVFYIPLNTHPCRITIDWMITTYFQCAGKVSIEIRYLVETIILDGLALIIAIAVPNIVVVFGLLGATATALCCYVMPGLLYIKAANLRWFSKAAFPPLFLAISGALCGLASTCTIIFDLIEDPSQLQ